MGVIQQIPPHDKPLKELLFIVYFFPPMGGSGVQRPLKYVKYLNEFGWKPIILVPEPGLYHTFDSSLELELQKLIDQNKVQVYRVKGGTPLHWNRSKTQWRPGIRLEKWLRRLSHFFYLPDNKKGWIKQGFQKAEEIIEKHSIQAIYATAPPYSNLMLAAKLKARLTIPTIMDFRDDWLESHLIAYPTPIHKILMRRLEASVLAVADMVIAINEPIASAISRRHPSLPSVVVQTHGYDSDDFDACFFPDNSIEKKPTNEKGLSQNETIRILYSGTFYADSGPGIFLRAVKKLIKEVPSLANIIELHFQGSPIEPYLPLINQLDLGELVHDHGYVPHNEAILRMQQAGILWLNNGHRKRRHTITLSKTYEYMATRRPIIALIPEGDTKKVLKDYSRSYITSPDDIEKVKKTILQAITHVQTGNLKPLNEQWLETFTRKAIAESLANKIDSLLDQDPVN